MNTLKEHDRARAEEAARLRKEGWTWKEVAAELGYANESGPFLLVKRHGLYDPACPRCGRAADVCKTIAASKSNAVSFPVALPQGSAV